MDNFNINEFFLENEYVTFDATKFPYLHLKFKIKEPTRTQFDEYVYCLNKVMLHQKDYIVLAELQNTEYMKAEFRKELEEWTIHINTFCKGSANVVLDEEQRLLLQHMIKKHTPAYPFFVTDSKQKAEEWLKGRV